MALQVFDNTVNREVFFICYSNGVRAVELQIAVVYAEFSGTQSVCDASHTMN